jgi:hypothetical protein
LSTLFCSKAIYLPHHWNLGDETLTYIFRITIFRRLYRLLSSGRGLVVCQPYSVSTSSDFLGDLPNSKSISRQKRRYRISRKLNPRKILLCGYPLFFFYLAVVCGLLGIFLNIPGNCSNPIWIYWHMYEHCSLSHCGCIYFCFWSFKHLQSL